MDGVLAKLLETLRLRITGADCEHHRAFNEILGLARLSVDEMAQVYLDQPVASWPIHGVPNREQLWADATLPAFGKQLLFALLLISLVGKLAVLAGLLTSPAVGVAGKKSFVDGLEALQQAVAQVGNAGRYRCSWIVAGLTGRVSEQFLGGPGSAGRRPYMPLSLQPARLIQHDPAIGFPGQPEAAAAFGRLDRALPPISGPSRSMIRSSRRAGH